MRLFLLLTMLGIARCGPVGDPNDYQVQAQVAANPNGGFESWPDPNTFPGGWRDDGTGHCILGSRVLRLAPGRTSTYALRLVPPDQGSIASMITQNFPVIGGANYRATFFSRVEWDAVCTLRVKVEWMRADGSCATNGTTICWSNQDFAYPPVTLPAPPNPTPPEWVENTIVVTAPSDAAQAYIQVEAAYHPGDIDDISLTQL